MTVFVICVFCVWLAKFKCWLLVWMEFGEILMLQVGESLECVILWILIWQRHPIRRQQKKMKEKRAKWKQLHGEKGKEKDYKNIWAVRCKKGPYGLFDSFKYRALTCMQLVHARYEYNTLVLYYSEATVHRKPLLWLFFSVSLHEELFASSSMTEIGPKSRKL